MQTKKPNDNRVYIILLILGASIIFLTAIKNWGDKKYKWGTKTTEERLEDSTAQGQTPFKVDSIQLAYKKVALSYFQQSLSADNWFEEFQANKVTFDKNYNNSKLDMWGIIGSIDDRDECPTIKLKVENDIYFKKITCVNCPKGIDKWSDEVTKVVVGDSVHVRGYYISSLSDDREIFLSDCHIIK